MASFSPLLSTPMQGNLPTQGVSVQHQRVLPMSPRTAPAAAMDAALSTASPWEGRAAAHRTNALLRWELTGAQQASSGSRFVPAHHRGHQAYSEERWHRAASVRTLLPSILLRTSVR